MLAQTEAGCGQCHDANSAGGKAAAEMAGLLAKLEGALGRSEEVLDRARQSGMEVSEAQLRQGDAREALIKARVAVHAFDPAAVRKAGERGAGHRRRDTARR